MNHGYLRWTAWATPTILSRAAWACLFIRTACCAVPGDPVLYWSFEDMDGGRIPDRSGRGFHGVVEGGRRTAEKGTASLAMDRFEGGVRAEEPARMPISTAVTIAVWIRADELPDHTVLLGRPHTNETWTTPMFGVRLRHEWPVFGLWEAPNVPKTLLAAERPLVAGLWTHLAAVYDGARMRWFVDGMPAGETNRTGPIADNGEPFRLGRGVSLGRPTFSGRFGAVRLYARGLDPAEVRALFEAERDHYDRTPPPTPPPPRDGFVEVESHGRSPQPPGPWKTNPTRILETLNGFVPPAGPDRRNRFGVSLDDPREAATGFFRLAKIGGRDWLIDPEGYRYFNIGLNAVRPPRGALSAFGSTQAWMEAVARLLWTNGFNGLGNWSAPEMREASRPLPWVLRCNFMFEFARPRGLVEPAAGTQGFPNRCMPVFHRDFEAHCVEFARQLEATANDPWMVGIMTDNELQCPVDLLDRCLNADPTDPHYRDNRAAAEAWLAARRPAGDRSPPSRRERYEFIAFAFERYYRLVVGAVRRYDTNHLYLGSRLSYSTGQFDNPWFWRAISPYHDAVSVNYYAAWGPRADHLRNWEEWDGRPIVFTEWYAKAMDVPGLTNTHGAGWLVRTQEDRGRYCQHFALAALEAPSAVGFHFSSILTTRRSPLPLTTPAG